MCTVRVVLVEKEERQRITTPAEGCTVAGGVLFFGDDRLRFFEVGMMELDPCLGVKFLHPFS